MDLREDIKSFIKSDTTLIREIQKVSYHTQDVKRCFILVTETSNKVCGHEDKNGYIRATLKSISLIVMPYFPKISDFKYEAELKITTLPGYRQNGKGGGRIPKGMWLTKTAQCGLDDDKQFSEQDNICFQFEISLAACRHGSLNKNKLFLNSKGLFQLNELSFPSYIVVE
ncbi:uncharacterized protein CEXT_481351 [Caerostris extrusa]|uniref:Uncharacterized protein n=1 Tax=Caerostris extrusa TaxID=172846 RepID=A0AAV4R5F0_CAEEX|nr:uncharacterized protein CEXT_481351 [Caerostris extrusa]